MSHLLDTHTFLWGQAEDPRLGSVAAALMVDPSAPVYLSVASAWEMSIKAARGRLDVPDGLASVVEEAGFDVLGIDLRHTAEAQRLPMHHRDPFDRMLVAQARIERLTLITADPAMAAYEVDLLDARR
ncbi:type II toxin-antitoxin system VapC family toxin [Iamia sp.]|uniref:type II toxin-antitoxin system VapC family toxin n=1 Tax=Iamia sp. TaxID=2722710 RepID=UPI002CE38425|nr:type II toxin-antitoxin system VapC family toxin [Iamia sp.]HXH56979.1 type II toxin-antitoxin system VapC family toxin [Iamia sp.]